MSEFQKSAPLIVNVGSALVGSQYYSNASLRAGMFQVAGPSPSSFNVQLQGTLFYDAASDTGSFWVAAGSVMTAGGFHPIDPKFAAYRIDCRSVSSGSFVFGAISFN